MTLLCYHSWDFHSLKQTPPRAFTSPTAPCTQAQRFPCSQPCFQPPPPSSSCSLLSFPQIPPPIQPPRPATTRFPACWGQTRSVAVPARLGTRPGGVPAPHSGPGPGPAPPGPDRPGPGEGPAPGGGSGGGTQGPKAVSGIPVSVWGGGVCLQRPLDWMRGESRGRAVVSRAFFSNKRSPGIANSSVLVGREIKGDKSD